MAATVAPMATRKRKRAVLREEDKEKEEEKNLIKELTAILKKARDQRTDEERDLLRNHPDHVIHIQKRLEKYRSRKARQEEYEEPESVIADKTATLAEAIRTARHLVVYTGAGVSTSASIPDYRGPDGIWTRLSQGRGIGQHDLTAADPTATHMALYGLWQRGLVRHVVSQNCDGLHLRSGLPKRHMSELHGNMYLEVCASCPRQYVRSFDVTPKTSRQNHKTGRRCYECATPLIDTVVHFGERGSLRWPLNWRGACRQARRSDVILCLGSSLKVLRKYSGLWCMHRPPHKRPRLFIVNLQWTPKDDCAALKINGRCDDVMLRVMEHLEVPIPQYSRASDPLLRLATPLHRSEPAPRCRLTRPEADTPPGTEGAEGAEESGQEAEPEESGPGRPDEAASRSETGLEGSPSRPQRTTGHPVERLADRLGADAATRSPTQSVQRPEVYPAQRSAERRVEERRRAERRSAAPGRPAECAVSPQSPPLRLPEGASLLLQTLLAGRPAAAAAAASTTAGSPPESAAQRRWPTDVPDCAVTDVTGDVTDVTGDVTCAVTELRNALVQTDPIEWREEEFTVVESLEEATCSSGDSSSGSEPGHSPDGRCLDLSHIRLMDGDRSPFCLSDDCLDRLSTSDVIFIDVPAAPSSLVDHDYSRAVGGVFGGASAEEDGGGDAGGGAGGDAGVDVGGDAGVNAGDGSDAGGGGGGGDGGGDAGVGVGGGWLGQEAQEAEGGESADGSVRIASHPSQSRSQSPVQYADAASQIEPLESDSQAGDTSQVESLAGDASQFESPAGDTSQVESLAGDVSQVESLAGDASQGESPAGDASQVESLAGDVESRVDSHEVGDETGLMESQDENSRLSQVESLDGNDSNRINDSRNGTSGVRPKHHEEDCANQTEFGNFDSLHEVASQAESSTGEAVTRDDSADSDVGVSHEESGEEWRESRDGFAPSRAESESGCSESRAESRVMHDVWMDGGDSSHDSPLSGEAGKLGESRERWLDVVDSSRDGAEMSQDSAELRKETFASDEDALDLIQDADSSQDNADLSRVDSNQDCANFRRDATDSSQDGINSNQEAATSTRDCPDSSQDGEPAGDGSEDDSALATRRRPGRTCSQRAVSYRDPSSSSDTDSNDSDVDSGPPPELAASSESSSDSSSESDGGDYVPFQAVFRVSRRMLKPVLAQDAGAGGGAGAGWYGRGCKARRKQRRLR